MTSFADAERAILARAPEHDLQPSLDRIALAMELLGDPQRSFRVVQVTGTNGKTSTARIIESVLRELGLTTGRFTSPHLHSVRERISIGGEPIGEQRFAAVYDEVLPLITIVDERSTAGGGPRMTYFEVLVVLAYAAFADAPVDVAVVEVGMGGSWDATNVVNADVAVIAPVDMDHMHFLGETIELIAAEKAGIIKPGSIAVSAGQQRSVTEILLERAQSVGARLIFEDVDFELLRREIAVGGQELSIRGVAGEYPDVFLDLHGEHQAHNATLAVAAVEMFLGGGEQRIEPAVLAAALAEVSSPGRLEVVRRSPTILVDAAHNPHGARALAAALRESFSFTTLVGVVAAFADKDVLSLLEALEPVLDQVVVTANSSPRTMAPAELGELAAEVFGEDRVTVAATMPDAIDTAAAIAEADGVGGGVIATGSVVTAADVRMLLGADRRGQAPTHGG